MENYQEQREDYQEESGTHSRRESDRESDEDSRSQRSEAKQESVESLPRENQMLTSIKNVMWTVEHDEQKESSRVSDGEQSPYSTKIIAINQEIERLNEEEHRADELNYSHDGSSRRESESARTSKKDITESGRESACQEREATSQKHSSSVMPAPPPSLRNQRAAPEDGNPIYLEIANAAPTTSSGQVGKTPHKIAIPLAPVDEAVCKPSDENKPQQIAKKKQGRRASKKKNVTSGTRLLDEYEVVDTIIKVEEPSSKALLSRCKSQDCLMPNYIFRKKKPVKQNTSPKKNEPVKVTQHLRSMRKALRDSINEDDKPHQLPSVVSEKVLKRVSRQLRTFNAGNSNKILPMFYSPKSVPQPTSSPESSPKLHKVPAIKQKQGGFGFAQRRAYPPWQEKNMKENPAPGSYESEQLSPKLKGPSFGLSHKYYEKVMIPKLEARGIPRRHLAKLNKLNR